MWEYPHLEQKYRHSNIYHIREELASSISIPYIQSINKNRPISYTYWIRKVINLKYISKCSLYPVKIKSGE